MAAPVRYHLADGLIYEWVGKRLLRGTVEIPISGRKHDVLRALIEAGGKPMSVRALTKKVWGDGYVPYRARVEIERIRGQLGAGTIVTNYGIGYSLPGLMAEAAS